MTVTCNSHIPPDRPIRCLFIHHTGCLGGAERSLCELITHLPTNCIHPVVAVPKGPLKTAIDKAGIETHDIPQLRLRRTACPVALAGTVLAVLRTRSRLARILKSANVDLLHANSRNAAWAAALMSYRCRSPLIWHERDLTPLRFPFRSLPNRCTHIFAISHIIRERLLQQGVPPERVSLVYNGIDTDRFAPLQQPPDRQPLGLPDSKTIILMCAQFVPWKKHDRFLDAAAKLATEFPDTVFVLAGSDLFDEHRDYVSKLKKRASQPPLDKRVLFPGFVDDIPAYYAHAACVVSTAGHEPFGRTVAEAMAAARPVVAIDNCGPAEIIDNGHNGLLVPPDNVNALVDAVSWILQNPAEATQMGNNAREHIKNRFSLDHLVRQFCKHARGVMTECA